jgi:hypothetical protein
MPETTETVYATLPYAERLIRSPVTIQRTRMLSSRGVVTRQIGDRVAADSIVVEADVPRGYRLIELDRSVGARKVIKQIGDVVERGEVIARTGFLVKKEYASPVGGQIIDIEDHRVLIEASPRKAQLMALYPGLIVDVIRDRGVVIETTGTLVQGTWGCGPAQRATLISGAPGGDVPLLGGQISGEHMGMVLIGGRTLDANAIAQAVDTRVRGIIVGSIHSDLLPILLRSGLSVIVTEGFGDIPMHPWVFELLHSIVGQEVCFQPSTRADWKTQRPEVFCSAPSQDRPALIEPSPLLDVGDRVRILRAPYQNTVGEIVSLPTHPRRLGSGITTWGAEVDLGPAGTAYIPLENLEIIR